MLTNAEPAGAGLPPDLAHDGDRRLTRRHAAAFLGVSVATLERWARLGTLKPVETGPNMSWYRLGDVRTHARGPQNGGARTRPLPVGDGTAEAHAAAST